MTTPHDPAAAPPVPDAVPVAVGHDLNVQGQAADFGSWAVYRLAGSEAAQPILPFDPFRHRATILASSAGAQEILPANPGGGAPLVYTLPYAAQILSVAFTYAASATVGSRFVQAEVTDPAGNVLAQIPASNAVVASTTVQPFLSSTSPYVSLAAQFASYNTFPAQVFPKGSQLILTAAGGMLAGDQISGVAIQLAGSGAVVVGTAAQCQQQLGGIVPGGQSVVVENNQQLWMAPAGGPVTVSVLTERWDNPGS